MKLSRSNVFGIQTQRSGSKNKGCCCTPCENDVPNFMNYIRKKLSQHFLPPTHKIFCNPPISLGFILKRPHPQSY